MKKKSVTRSPKPQTIFSTEEEYWNYYAKRSFLYKSIDLHNWKKRFQEILDKDPKNVMAQGMLKRCAEEEKLWAITKIEHNKEADALLLVKEHVTSSKRPKK